MKEENIEKQSIWQKYLALSYNKRYLIVLAFVVFLFAVATTIIALVIEPWFASMEPSKNVNWYGYMIGMAIVLCILGGQYALTKQGYYSDLLFDYVIFAVPCAFGGAVLYYGLSNNFNFNGLAVIGGLFGAVLGIVIALVIYKYLAPKKPKMKLLWILDLAGVFVPLGQAIGRVGCLFGGCCYGITLPALESLEGTFYFFFYRVNGIGPMRLCNPMIESIWCLICFIPLVIAYISKRKCFDGFYISLYCILYGLERCILETYRAPGAKLLLSGGYGEGFGVSQFTSILMIAFGVIFIVVYLVRAKLSGKKFMIFVPREKLSDEYFGYNRTIFVRPHVDSEGRPISYGSTAGKVTIE